MDAATMLEIRKLDGHDTPAFIALYTRVVQTMTKADRDRLAIADESVND